MPQGWEYRVVCKGLRRVSFGKPKILQIPIGARSFSSFLEKCSLNSSDRPQKILLMGLCGSLSPQYRVGDAVIYQECLSVEARSAFECSCELTDWLKEVFEQRIKTVRGLTSDRLINLALEKQRLRQLYAADVVDMEGFTLIKTLQSIFLESTPEIAILRVVSDDCDRDIPSLERAIDANGSLQALPLAISFIQQPIAATRLIKGSLTGLKALEQLASELASKNYKQGKVNN